MDLYEAIVIHNGSNYRACITELYYKYLSDKGLSYKNSTVEIPLCEFKKIAYYY